MNVKDDNDYEHNLEVWNTMKKKSPQSWTKYFARKAEIQKNWTEKEKFGIYFCVLFNSYRQSLIYWRETGN